MTTKELQTKIIEWATERGIFETGTRIKQSFKTLEECGELIEAIGASAVFNEDDNAEDIYAIAKHYDHAIKDAIGDIIVTLIIQAKMNDLDIEDCLLHAYNQIKDRKGSMVNGTFVKEKF